MMSQEKEKELFLFDFYVTLNHTNQDHEPCETLSIELKNKQSNKIYESHLMKEDLNFTTESAEGNLIDLETLKIFLIKASTSTRTTYKHYITLHEYENNLIMTIKYFPTTRNIVVEGNIKFTEKINGLEIVSPKLSNENNSQINELQKNIDKIIMINDGLQKRISNLEKQIWTINQTINTIHSFSSEY